MTPEQKIEIEAKVKSMTPEQQKARRDVLSMRLAAAKNSVLDMYRRHSESWQYELDAIDWQHAKDFVYVFEI
jgi:hypothetical protein